MNSQILPETANVVGHSLTAVVTASGGVASVIASLVCLLFRRAFKKQDAKIHYEREQELERRKSDLARDSQAANLALSFALGIADHSYRAQIDHEYGLYRELWSTLHKLRTSTHALRPMLDRYEADESNSDRVARRAEPHLSAFEALRDQVMGQEPFLPANIYEALMRVLGEAFWEGQEYIMTTAPDATSRQSARDNQEAINKAVELARDAIRARIQEFSAPPRIVLPPGSDDKITSEGVPRKDLHDKPA